MFQTGLHEQEVALQQVCDVTVLDVQALAH